MAYVPTEMSERPVMPEAATRIHVFPLTGDAGISPEAVTTTGSEGRLNIAIGDCPLEGLDFMV